MKRVLLKLNNLIKIFISSLALFMFIFTNANAGIVLPDFSSLVEAVGPSVVNIRAIKTAEKKTTSSKNKSPKSNPFFDEEDPFFEFFKRFPGIPNMPNSPNMPNEEIGGTGSGFFISDDGYILTNAHVVQDFNKITVRLVDKREFEAKVIGSDKRSDVALIKIEGKGFPFVKIGDPEKLKVGEWVLAIGSPFGFDNTVTAGIVSAKGRDLPSENLVPFIQTDTAVNPGNSGGPLINTYGEVVAINSQIFSRSGAFAGIAFAIPIDLAMEVQKQLRDKGRVARGKLGITIREVTKELADSFGMKEAIGALVSEVAKGEAGDKSGIKPGDVITEFDGKQVKNSRDLPRIVGATAPGKASQFKVWRGNKEITLNAKLGEWTDDKLVTTNDKNSKGEKAPQNVSEMGLSLRSLNADELKESGVNHGVIIEGIENEDAQGLRQGDVILSIFDKGKQSDIKTPADFDVAYKKASSAFTIMVLRAEQRLFISIKK